MTKHLFWILDDDKHAVAVDAVTWGMWFDNFRNRRIAHTEIAKDIAVSTIFVGIDMRIGGQGPPMLFESAIITDHDIEPCQRYCSYDDAITGHSVLVRRLIKQRVIDRE